MSRQIQLRRGTAEEHKNFTGALGEVTYDTTHNTLRVHDGITPGGVVLVATNKAADPETLDYIIETGHSGSTWWRKYKSGGIDIGGRYTGGSATINLPVTLANSDYSVLLTKNSAPSNWAAPDLSVSTCTPEYFCVLSSDNNVVLDITWQITNATVSE